MGGFHEIIMYLGIFIMISVIAIFAAAILYDHIKVRVDKTESEDDRSN